MSCAYRLGAWNTNSVSVGHAVPKLSPRRVRTRSVECLSEPTNTDIATRRSKLLSNEESAKDTWSPLTRYSYDDQAHDAEKTGEQTRLLPRYKVVLACMLAFVVCNMVRSAAYSCRVIHLVTYIEVQKTHRTLDSTI